MKNKILGFVFTSLSIIISGAIFKFGYDQSILKNYLCAAPLFIVSFLIFHVAREFRRRMF